ncbi:hypothetical protein ACLKA7_006313 [Drosophila subpalustris]
MSIRKYKNPVNNHFIYNDDIRKSTCKICFFDMAGRHSENLMRHLMRKHPATYAEVMLEKQRRRSAVSNQTGSTTDTSASAGGPLSSMFKFETEPHKLLIKSNPNSNTFSHEYDDEDEDPTGNGQFESVYLAKAELRDGQLNDSNESLSYQGSHPEEGEFIISNLSPQTSGTPAETPVAAATVATSNATSSGSSTMATIAGSNPDDAFYLQYLANKFGKYSANTRNTVQFHINRILYKADMGCYDNADASKISETDI